VAASTITRDAWTNDTGTPSAPVGDGTILNNTVLQNHIYARIDAMFAGAGAYATFTLGGLVAVEGFGSHTFSAGGTGGNFIAIRNTTAGTSMHAGYRLGNDASATAASLIQTSTTYTAAGNTPQDGMLLDTTRSGGLSLSASHASGVIRFYTGGTTVRALFFASGAFATGSTLTDLGSSGQQLNSMTDAGVGTKAEILKLARTGASTSATGRWGGITFSDANNPTVTGAVLGYRRDSVADFSGAISIFAHTDAIATTAILADLAEVARFGKSNTFCAQGLTLKQAAYTDEILSCQASSIAHGMTSETETTTFAGLKLIPGNSGGFKLSGFGADIMGLQLAGHATVGDTTKSTAGSANIMLKASKKSGTTVGIHAANENLVAVQSFTTTRFILDADGDSHQDVGTAWTNFDAFDDIALVNALSAAVSRPGDPLRAEFRELLESHRPVLERLRIVTFNDDGHHFLNWSRYSMLLTGAVRQLAQRIVALETRTA
jgi:hypothetical protein